MAVFELDPRRTSQRPFRQGRLESLHCHGVDEKAVTLIEGAIPERMSQSRAGRLSGGSA
jgi:hypothetical protein